MSVDLERLPQVRKADVYKAGTHAATLQRTAAGVEFAYTNSYLASSTRPVATTLPLTDAPVRNHAGAVPPFFAGLLPEGRRLGGLRRAVKTSADDELSLLLAVGSDLIGDVQVVPEGAAPVAADAALEVVEDWADVRFSEVLADAGVVDPVGLPGVQDKVSARMISLPIERSGERYLLKVDVPEYPHVVENEAYFLALARRLRIKSAHATVVHDAVGRPGLLVRRFDRIAQVSGSTVSLACEDACQVLDRWPADKYNVTTEEVVRGLSSHCAASAVAIRSLYQQLCFGWLTGNGDIHAKNLSILSTLDGEWQVAPAYDLPSTVPYGDHSLALSIGGRTRGLARRHFIEFAAAVELPERVALRVLDDLLVRLADLGDALTSGVLPFDQDRTTKAVRELRHRRHAAEA